MSYNSPYKSNSTLVLNDKSYLVSLIQDGEALLNIPNVTPYQTKLLGRCVSPKKFDLNVIPGTKSNCVFNGLKGDLVIYNITQSRWSEVTEAQGFIFKAYFYPVLKEQLDNTGNPFIT